MDWDNDKFDDETDDLISYGVFLGEGGGGTGKPPKNKKSIVIKIVIVAIVIALFALVTQIDKSDRNSVIAVLFIIVGALLTGVSCLGVYLNYTNRNDENDYTFLAPVLCVIIGLVMLVAGLVFIFN
ncbi:MAG: hypothetical protein ACI4HM_00725 [Ruminococcus sp.]